METPARWCAAVVGALLLTACPPASPGGDGGAPGKDGGTGLLPDGGLATAPVLTSLGAHVSSRTGRDLRFTFVAQDRERDVVSLWVRLTDAAGAPAKCFDTDRDGVGDSAEGQIPVEKGRLVGEVLTAEATLVGALTRRTVARVSAAVVDAKSLRSDELAAAVVPQPIRSLGSPCDPLFLTDRCAAGLGCRGTPPTCQEGLPPQITRMAFYRNSAGPLILIEGTEPEDDIATVGFTFRDARGQPVTVDSDGDGSGDLSSFDYEVVGQAVDGAFFIRLQAAVGLDLQVPKLVAKPVDQASHTGQESVVAPTDTPIRGAGQACDARGFDACGAGLVCSPGLVGAANKCLSAATLRSSVCAAAPVLVASTAGASLIGQTTPASLWDAPAGCSSNDPKGRPEGLVKLRLAQRTNRLTLTTANGGTTFDTALYLLEGCPSSSDRALGCNDDIRAGNPASTLSVTNLPAGDYLVVVDSFDLVGGTFELKATVE